jgi:DNA-binding ferritin-like protein
MHHDIGPRAAKVASRRLVAAIELHARVRHVQRNLRGPATAEIRALLDNLAAAVEGYSDQIAALATAVRDICKPAFPRRDTLAVPGDEADLAALIAACADFRDAVRSAGEAAKASDDIEIAEICIGVARGIDYELWALEAHLAGRRERRRWRSPILGSCPLRLVMQCSQAAFR